jgi:peptidoglycan L-alanyl-D-glutamate endopeptidase CwlK
MRLTDTLLLHKEFRDRVRALEQELGREGIPLWLYEGARSPFRQSELYARGRSTEGHIVTRAKPWQSFHQYGLAADYVFKHSEKWTWEEPEDGMWARYTELATACGLVTLSFERPHCQFGGSTIDELLAGHYPGPGGASWQSWLGRQIELWRASNPQGTPCPPPFDVDHRPPLGEGEA